MRNIVVQNNIVKIYKFVTNSHFFYKKLQIHHKFTKFYKTPQNFNKINKKVTNSLNLTKIYALKCSHLIFIYLDPYLPVPL